VREGRAAAAVARGSWDAWQSQWKGDTHLEIGHGQLRRFRSAKLAQSFGQGYLEDPIYLSPEALSVRGCHP